MISRGQSKISMNVADGRIRGDFTLTPFIDPRYLPVNLY